MPEQTLATRAPRLATACTNLIVHVFRAAASTPSPPATMSAVIALAGPNFRASISTPEELRTGPGVCASALIGTGDLA